MFKHPVSSAIHMVVEQLYHLEHDWISSTRGREEKFFIRLVETYLI